MVSRQHSSGVSFASFEDGLEMMTTWLEGYAEVRSGTNPCGRGLSQLSLVTLDSIRSRDNPV
jgi:hypothetical protein